MRLKRERDFSEKVLGVLDAATSPRAGKLNALQTLRALEAAYDRIHGPGTGAEITVNGEGFLSKINLIAEAMSIESVPKASAARLAAAPAATVPPTADALETYESLLGEDPRAAGQFYSENADEIANETGVRYRAHQKAIRAAQPWNIRQ